MDVSHVIYRCVVCEALHKIRLNQFIEMMTNGWVGARHSEESELVVVCETCRDKASRK